MKRVAVITDIHANLRAVEATAWRMRSATSGSFASRRNSVPKNTSIVLGSTAVTVAERRPSPTIASSPKKSPGPRTLSSFRSWVTSAVPLHRTKNE